MTAESRIRRAVDDDLSTLVSLRFQWNGEDRSQGDVEFDQFSTKFAEWHSGHRQSHVAYLVEWGDRAVGVGWLAVVDRVPGPERFIRRAGTLQGVFVQEAYRGRGLGGDVVERMINDAREMGLDYLMVHPSTASFSLYQRWGFQFSEKVLELRLVDR